MAGAAGLEPVTSAVTGQRSNQLSYAPAKGTRTYEMPSRSSRGTGRNVRAADAKEVGVGNPAEETCCHPNTLNLRHFRQPCQHSFLQHFASILRSSPSFRAPAFEESGEVGAPGGGSHSG